LEIHKKTFVYYNGDGSKEKHQARLRNFLPGGRHFLAAHILDNKKKAESHRLGAENSEDALTWNVFGELHRLGLTHVVYNMLTGENAAAKQVKLFLWGLNIDFADNRADFWECLENTRRSLENGIRRFLTEPDIILLGPKMLILIEAKFTSGNTVSVENEDVADEKPKSRHGLIQRYIENNQLWAPVLCRGDLGETIHSQLLRMIVFACTMAQINNLDWKVVNLVSRTQWNKCGVRKGYDFKDPTNAIPKKVTDHFRFLYWEDFYHAILANEPLAKEIAEYIRKKSANLLRAFDL
jgi:Holliday junction resolvase-like predicted endonuclease